MTTTTTTKALTDDQRRRLIACLGMLGSDHDGERAAAAWQVSKIVRTAGIAWDDLLVRADVSPARSRTYSSGYRYPPGQAPRTTAPPASGMTIAEVLRTCEQRLDELNGWERNFVVNLRQHFMAGTLKMTPARLDALERIVTKLRQRGY